VANIETDDGGVKMEAGHDLSFRPDVSLCAGGEVKGPGWTLEAIPTPGHTSNHLCYALKEENACFTGDHIMGWSTTVITPPDGDMSDYLASLEAIRARRFEVLWPTHGPPIREVDAFIAAYAEHRQERLDQILQALKPGPAKIGDLVPRLYADVDARLHPAAARSMLAGMIHLVRQGRLAADGEPGADATYRLA
jgi:glyoxylase-like metal-dependent hydrolase (beta-lactamase superfamily II)